jgi:hypothetical protein
MGMSSLGVVALVEVLAAVLVFWLCFHVFRILRIAILRRILGPQWKGHWVKGHREVWLLRSSSGKTIDNVRYTPGGRWTTNWGREFKKLTDAARWVELKHSENKEEEEPVRSYSAAGGR